MHRYISLFLIAVGLMQSAFGQNNSTSESQGLNSAKSWDNEINKYRDEGEKFSSYELAQKVSALKANERLRRKPNASVFSNDAHPDQLKAIGYLDVLHKRRIAGESEAAFQYGIHELAICSAILKYGGEQTTPIVCEKALDSLKLAANSSDPRAMRVVAVIYEEGLGVSPSSYLAADWYIKAARQYEKQGQREGALENLELALKAVPDHPAGLKLKSKLLR